MHTLIHYIFTPKFRKHVFENYNIAYKCEALMRDIASQKDIEVMALAVQPDHVHVFVTLPRTMSVAQGAMLLKWYSSRWLRILFPQLKAQKALWGHRYFHASVGGNRATLNEYIANQVRLTGGE